MGKTIKSGFADNKEAWQFIAEILGEVAHDEEDWLDVLSQLYRTFRDKDLEGLIIREALDRNLCPQCFLEGRGATVLRDDEACPRCKEAILQWYQTHIRQGAMSNV